MASKTIAEQLVALKATRETLQKKLDEVVQKSIDEGRSMNTAEAEEFESSEGEIDAIDKDIERLTRQQARQQATAKAVDDTEAKSAPARHSNVQIKTVEKLEPGIAFSRYAMCLVKAKGNHATAFNLAERHYPNTESVVQTLKAQAEGLDLAELMKYKATVAAGTTTNATWASPLVYAENWGGDFVNFTRPRSLIGQADFRAIPFNVRVAGATSGGSAGWVGEGKAKPVTKFDFNALTSSYTKVAAISVITQELARLSDPSAEAIVRDMLADAVIAQIDQTLFSDDAAVAGVSPAGLLNGVTPVPGPASNSVIDIRCAIMALWASWDATNLGARPAYYTTPAVARFLAFTVDALGNQAFPGITANGGTLLGVPVRVSNYLSALNTSGGGPLILVDESEVYLADDGSVTLDASMEASIEMSDTPLGSSSPTVAASSVNFVSMFQTNSIALRAERPIWWGLRRAGAVQAITDFPTSC